MSDILSGAVSENDSLPVRVLKLAYAAQNLTVGGPGSDTTALHFASATVYHTDGTSAAYLTAADTNAARGTALLAGVTAMSAGETIGVSAGTFNTAGMAKAGGTFNYDFPAGANISYSGTASDIFSDFTDAANADIAPVIGGFGSFTATGASKSVFRLTRSGSTMAFQANRVVASGVGGIGVRQAGGTLDGAANYISGENSGLAWTGGDAKVHAKEFHQTNTGAGGAIWADISNPATVSKWHVSGDLAEGAASGIYFSSENAANRLWCDVQKVVGGTLGGLFIRGAAGTYYGNHQKIEAPTTGNTLVYPAIQIGNDATNNVVAHIVVMKVEGGADDTGSGVITIASGNTNTSYLTVLDEVLDTGMIVTPVVNMSSGNIDLVINRLVRTISGHCLDLTEGIMKLSNSYISTGGFATKNAIRGTSAVTLTLRNVHLQVHAAADSIASSDGSTFTVLCLGGVTSNRPVGANVVCTGAGLLVI